MEVEFALQNMGPTLLIFRMKKFKLGRKSRTVTD